MGTIPPEMRPHGVRARYLTGCRCLPCRAAHATYVYAHWRGEVASLVSAAQAKTKLDQLARLGVGRRRAAELAGISQLTVFRIRRGLTSMIHPDTESAILGIRPSLAKGCYVPAYDAKRLLLSLLGEEYEPRTIAQTLGVHPLTIGRLQQQTGRKIRVSTALKLRAMWQHVNHDGECAQTVTATSDK